MPAANIRAIRQHAFSASDRLLLDTNIWLFINGPQGDPGNTKSKIYSDAYREIITHQSTIYIDALTLSEFINRYARLSHQLWEEDNGEEIDFKEFRDTPAFLHIAQEIEQAAHMILIDAMPIETGFTNMNIRTALHEYSLGKKDFNDLIFIELCKTQNLVLVTDDADFASAGIPILTNNPRLLR